MFQRSFQITLRSLDQAGRASSIPVCMVESSKGIPQPRTLDLAIESEDWWDSGTTAQRLTALGEDMAGA